MQPSGIIARIADLTETRDGGIAPAHSITDHTKYDALVASMERDGWQGAPIVVDGDQALTGSHRYWAAHATGTEIPRITIEEVCEACDVGWDAHCDEFDDPYEQYCRIADKLPTAVVDYLGMDLN